MSLQDKINSVQGIALSALQAAAKINTYLSTFVAPDIGGIPAASFNNTSSSLVSNTIPTLLPTSRFNIIIDNYRSRSEASSTYVSTVKFTTFTININNALIKILNDSETVSSDIGKVKATIPTLLSINGFTITICSCL